MDVHCMTMMDTTEIDENHACVRERNVVIEIETVEGVLTTHEPMKQASNSAVPSSLRPLINSMMPFGIYFTRKPRVTAAATGQPSCQSPGGYLGWNRARIYATIMLVLTWLNAVRSCVIFDGNETLGADLFTKLGVIPGVLLMALLHTTYYIASHTGSLDAIFREMNHLSAYDDFSVKFSRRAKLATAVGWLLVASGVSYNIYYTFAKDRFHDFLLLLISRTFHMSKMHLYMIHTVFVMLHIHAVACWAFTQAMKHGPIRIASLHAT